jgi:tetratricopeptide (TPR) repeat protein
MVDAHKSRGNALVKLHRFDEAIADFNAVLQLRPNHESLLNRGFVYALAKRYDKALIDLTKVIEMAPTFADAYYLRGAVFEKTDQFDRAASDYEAAVKFDAGNPEYAEALKRLKSMKAI